MVLLLSLELEVEKGGNKPGIGAVPYGLERDLQTVRLRQKQPESWIALLAPGGKRTTDQIKARATYTTRHLCHPYADWEQEERPRTASLLLRSIHPDAGEQH